MEATWSNDWPNFPFDGSEVKRFRTLSSTRVLFDCRTQTNITYKLRYTYFECVRFAFGFPLVLLRRRDYGIAYGVLARVLCASCDMVRTVYALKHRTLVRIQLASLVKLSAQGKPGIGNEITIYDCPYDLGWDKVSHSDHDYKSDFDLIGLRIKASIRVMFMVTLMFYNQG